MDEIRRLLDRINDAWLNGRPESIVLVLSECFHEEIVMRGPGLAEVGRGRAVCAKSYEDFVRSATIRDWSLSEPVIDVWGDTAAATYSWEMAYEMNSRTCAHTFVRAAPGAARERDPPPCRYPSNLNRGCGPMVIFSR